MHGKRGAMLKTSIGICMYACLYKTREWHGNNHIAQEHGMLHAKCAPPVCQLLLLGLLMHSTLGGRAHGCDVQYYICAAGVFKVVLLDEAVDAECAAGLDTKGAQISLATNEHRQHCPYSLVSWCLHML